MITRTTKQRTRVERGMLMCWAGIEEGTAGCLFIVHRVQQLFRNKESHQKELLAQLLQELSFQPRQSHLDNSEREEGLLWTLFQRISEIWLIVHVKMSKQS